MVKALAIDEPRWLAPQPLWTLGAENNRMRRIDRQEQTLHKPAILRFASDSFMEELLAVLRAHPDELYQWVASYETWRRPLPQPSLPEPLNLAEPPSELSRKLKRRRLSAATQAAALPQTAANDSEPQPTIPAEDQPSIPGTLKLYQPAHQRFYLVAASIVNRQQCLPDRHVDTGKEQSASFVLRRLVKPETDSADAPISDNPADWREHAFVLGPDGRPSWREVGAGTPFEEDELLPEEQRIPLFRLDYCIGNKCRPRRMLAGVIPVAKREAYLAAPAYQTPSVEQPSDHATNTATSTRDIRREVFDTRVLAPWSQLIEQAAHTGEQLDRYRSDPIVIGEESAQDVVDSDRFEQVRDALLLSSRVSIQTTSWYVLLDFALFLERHLPNVWGILNGDPETTGPNEAEENLISQLDKIALDDDLIDELENAFAGSSAVKTLREALLAIHPLEADLELVDRPYQPDASAAVDIGWPHILFPLADPLYAAPEPDIALKPETMPDEPIDQTIERINELGVLVQAAMPGPAISADGDSVLHAPTDLDTRQGWFRIRCVYERPNCGPFHPTIVSQPTDVFEFASFFDPDAPARPVRIPMPVDISPAGLRKFKRNTALIASDLLCGQIKQIRKLTLGDLVLSVLPWPFHKDLPSVSQTVPCAKGSNPMGLIISLSIPIVTLCALILLIIMVALFDQFFRWLPLLFTIRRIAGLKGKKP